MTRAWEIKKRFNKTMGECLKLAWSEAKGYSNISNLTKRITVKETATEYEVSITDFDFGWTLKKVKEFENRKYNSETKTWNLPKGFDARFDITTFAMYY